MNELDQQIEDYKNAIAEWTEQVERTKEYYKDPATRDLIDWMMHKLVDIHEAKLELIDLERELDMTDSVPSTND